MNKNKNGNYNNTKHNSDTLNELLNNLKDCEDLSSDINFHQKPNNIPLESLVNPNFTSEFNNEHL